MIFMNSWKDTYYDESIDNQSGKIFLNYSDPYRLRPISETPSNTMLVYFNQNLDTSTDMNIKGPTDFQVLKCWRTR